MGRHVAYLQHELSPQLLGKRAEGNTASLSIVQGYSLVRNDHDGNDT